MATYQVKSVRELLSLVGKHARQREQRVKGAIRKTARKGAALVRKNVPVASSELRDGIDATDDQIRSDAPHSEAVEKGSRPHWMPLEPLIKWVKLRGSQGLLSDRQLGRLKGPTTEYHARSIAQQLSDQRRGGAVGVETNYTSLDAPTRIAKAIQLAIALKGTKPHWYMRDSLPEILGFLKTEIDSAVPDR